MSYSCVQGDLTQPMPLTLKVNGVATAIAVGSTATLRWTQPDGTTTTVALTVVDLDAGEVQRVWEEGDTDQVGAHFGQVIVTGTGGDPETFPNDGSFIIWNVYRQLP